MGNCLVTKLKGTVDNDNLMRLGELPIKFNQVAQPSDATNAITIRAVYSGEEGLTCRVINGYFTDSTFTQNLGTTHTIADWQTETLYISNTGATLFIPNKYNCIGKLLYVNGSVWERQNIEIDLENMQYIRYMNELMCRGFHIVGDINNLLNSVELGAIDFTNCYDIEGSLDHFLNNIQVTSMDLRLNGKTTLNLNNLTKENIYQLYIYNCDEITGPLSNIKFSNTYSRYPLSLNLGTRNGNGVTGTLMDLANNFFVKYNPASADNIGVGVSSLPNITGLINDFCDDAVTKGKVSGKIRFSFNFETQQGITVDLGDGNGAQHITKNSYEATFTASGYTIA